MDNLPMEYDKTFSSVTEIPDGHFDGGDINRHLYEGIHFRRVYLRGSYVKSSRFNGCSFEDCDLVKMSFQRTQFEDCEFLNCTFSELTSLAATFHRCHFRECMFAKPTNFQRVDFLGCMLDSCNFNEGLRYITGECTEVRVNDTDFSKAFLQNLRIRGELSKVSFDCIKAKSLDFSGAVFDRVSFDGARLVRGVFIGVENLERRLFYTCQLDDCDFEWVEAFVIMGFGRKSKSGYDLDNYYDQCIKPVLEELNIDPLRTDRYEFDGRITDEILGRIKTCTFVVAELSGFSENAFFEVGYALGTNKDVIFCIDDEQNIPFDLKDYPFIIHGTNLDRLRQKLRQRVAYMLSKRLTQTEEA